MSKFKYFTYIIGAILLFSSFDVQKCADALQKAYEEKKLRCVCRCISRQVWRFC